MRYLIAAVVVVLCAGAAGAQLLTVGVGAGTTWEYRSEAAAGNDWHHRSEISRNAFAALTIDDETQLRLRVVELPYDVMLGGEAWPAHIRAATVGIDYTMPGVIGRAVLLGGFGAYRLDLEAEQPPSGVEREKLGWYLGVGEWFALTRHSRITLEITYDQAPVHGHPQIFTAGLGLAYSF